MADKRDIEPVEAWQKIRNGALVLDVRRQDEWEEGHLSQATHIPHDGLEARLAELDSWKEKEIIVHCKSGGRSDFAQKLLQAAGFQHVYNGGGYESLKAAAA